MDKQFLSQRKQKVGLKSCFSSLKSIYAGVPQGSVLRPLLFLVYINGIAKHLLSLTSLFTDDCLLFDSATHIADIAVIINYDLQLLTNLTKQWLVTFNPLKTEGVLLTLKKLDLLPRLVLIISQLALLIAINILVLPLVAMGSGIHMLKISKFGK